MLDMTNILQNGNNYMRIGYKIVIYSVLLDLQKRCFKFTQETRNVHMYKCKRAYAGESDLYGLRTL